MNMRKDALWQKVIEKFPNDPVMQEVHYARLKISKKTKGMSVKEYVEYIKSRAKEVMKELKMSKS